MKRLSLLLLLISSPALAQQQPDTAFMQRAITAIQTQRNAALDQAVLLQAKVDGLTEDLAKAQARIKELEPKPEDKK